MIQPETTDLDSKGENAGSPCCGARHLPLDPNKFKCQKCSEVFTRAELNDRVELLDAIAWKCQMPALISSTPAFDWKRLAIDLQRVDKGELTQQEITDLDFCQEHYLTYEWASSKQHVAAFSTALGEHLSQGKPQSVFRKENDRWVIVYDGKEVLPQPDRRYKGFGYIQYLLQHPGTPVSPFEVPGGDSRGEASREQINELLGELFGYSVSDMGAAKDGASAMKLLRQLEQRLVEEQGVSTDAERHVEIDD